MLQFYFWDNDVFVDYTSGCAFAIAESREDALEQIAKDHNKQYSDRKDLTQEQIERYLQYSRELIQRELTPEKMKVLPLDQKYAFMMYGGG